MCGIIGAAGQLTNQHEKAIKVLLVLDSLRGEDSTGAAFINMHSGNVTVAKQLGDPFNLFNDNKFTGGMGKMNRAIIGHNRYATSGGVARSTAHPFEFDTLVGVHNGTLNSKWKLDDQADFKVDSQALYHGFEKNGVKDTINRLGADGNAWSLVWWDKVEQTINFLRNKERPMFMCRTEDGKVLFWASEYWMLEVALDRQNIKRGMIFHTEVNQHYSVHIDNKGNMDKPRIALVEAPVYVPPVTQVRPSPSTTVQAGTAKPPHISSNVSRLPSPHPATAVTPATSKGVVDTKKPQSNVVAVNGSVCDPSYLKVKERKFEMLNGQTDSNGSAYISLFDPLSPYVEVRVYPRKEDLELFDLLGRDISGDIGSYDFNDKKAIRGYYKVSPWTVKLLPEEAPDAPFDNTIYEDPAEELFPNHRGHFVTESEWKKTYTMCEWCTESVSPLNRNRFTSSGQCICPGCSKLPEVTEVVNLI